MPPARKGGTREGGCGRLERGGDLGEKGTLSRVLLGTALVDMYSKCGAIAKAMELFESLGERNVYTCTSAISGLATNGMGLECL
jgi:hypothetical protein